MGELLSRALVSKTIVEDSTPPVKSAESRTFDGSTSMQEDNTATQDQTEVQNQHREFDPATANQADSNTPQHSVHNSEEEQRISQSNAYEVQQMKKLEALRPVEITQDTSAGSAEKAAPPSNLGKNIG